MVAIQIHNLSKIFRHGKTSVQALKGVSFEVPQGVVFGFLGPNGAGKSTTIRILMDLIRPTEGQARIFGQDVQAYPDILQRVGAMVEDPNFYSHLSGKDNLKVLAQTAEIYDPKRIDQLLRQVGLDEKKASRKISAYSTGMKQRLGLAAVLLNDPKLVILDEPTNGLDPAGIQEMRAVFRRLVNEDGKTVFISSHLLHEVEQVCDQVAIINLGEIIQQGNVKNLLAEGQAETRFQVSQLDRAYTLLKEKGAVLKNKDWLSIHLSSDETPAIIKYLVENSIDIHQVVQNKQSLEDFFMTVTQENGNGETANV